jgi:AbrB family looped-hinge helix DNA binding protein
MDVAITRMSSKGQIVIPAEMRTDILEGEKLLLIQNDHQIIMKKASDMDKNLAEDIKFANKTEAAWKRIEEGKGIKKDFDDFLETMKKW